MRLNVVLDKPEKPFKSSMVDYLITIGPSVLNNGEWYLSIDVTGGQCDYRIRASGIERCWRKLNGLLIKIIKTLAGQSRGKFSLALFIEDSLFNFLEMMACPEKWLSSIVNSLRYCEATLSVVSLLSRDLCAMELWVKAVNIKYMPNRKLVFKLKDLKKSPDELAREKLSCSEVCVDDHDVLVTSDAHTNGQKFSYTESLNRHGAFRRTDPCGKDVEIHDGLVRPSKTPISVI